MRQRSALSFSQSKSFNTEERSMGMKNVIFVLKGVAPQLREIR